MIGTLPVLSRRVGIVAAGRRPGAGIPRWRDRTVLLQLCRARALEFALGLENLLGGRNHVPVMKKGVLVQTDINKSGLQRGLEVADLAFKDGADYAPAALPLEIILLNFTVGRECSPDL